MEFPKTKGSNFVSPLPCIDTNHTNHSIIQRFNMVPSFYLCRCLSLLGPGSVRNNALINEAIEGTKNCNSYLCLLFFLFLEVVVI